MTLKARSLVPLRAGPLTGLTARPYFTRRYDMMHRLQALAGYCKERWAAKIGQGLGDFWTGSMLITEGKRHTS